MRIVRFFVFSLSLVLVSCDSSTDASDEIDPEVEGYVRDMVRIMQNESVNKYTIDWEVFELQVLREAKDAESIFDLDDAYIKALQLLGDNHSFIVKTDGTILTGSTLRCDPVTIETALTPDRIGYVRVGPFSGSDLQAATDYANAIQESIRMQDSQDLAGWIVDLRNNTGGNMWPMLAAIGPILGDGTAGYFIDPDREVLAWSFDSGAAILGATPVFELEDSYELINPNPKVAVLLNDAVSSSGEAIAIAFRGRENTASFGSATCGLTTANTGFRLRFGTQLVLTTATLVDRTLEVYGMSLTPDNPSSGTSIIQDAIDYLEN